MSSSSKRAPPLQLVARRSRSLQKRAFGFDSIDTSSLNSSLSDPFDPPQHSPQVVRPKSHASSSKSSAWKDTAQCIDDSSEEVMPPPLNLPPHRRNDPPAAKGRVTPSKRAGVTNVDLDDERYSGAACALSPPKRMREDSTKSPKDGIFDATASTSKAAIRFRTLFNPSSTDDDLSEA